MKQNAILVVTSLLSMLGRRRVRRSRRACRHQARTENADALCRGEGSNPETYGLIIHGATNHPVQNSTAG
jgi:hypothetical protein